MKPTPVHRFYFSLNEAIAALFPSGIPALAREMRIEGDELIIDFISPTVAQDDPDDGLDRSAEDAGDDFPGDRPSTQDKPADNRPAAKVGPNEQEARDLCSQRGFQTFLEVRTEEAAQKILLEKCKSPDFRSLDTEKYKKAAFRDVVADYELWLRG